MDERSDMTKRSTGITRARAALTVCLLMTTAFIIVLMGSGRAVNAQVDPYASESPSVAPTLITTTSKPSQKPTDKGGEIIGGHVGEREPKEVLTQVEGKPVLPLTGADLTLFVATGASMIGTGALVFRRSRRRR